MSGWEWGLAVYVAVYVLCLVWYVKPNLQWARRPGSQLHPDRLAYEGTTAPLRTLRAGMHSIPKEVRALFRRENDRVTERSREQTLRRAIVMVSVLVFGLPAFPAAGWLIDTWLDHLPGSSQGRVVVASLVVGIGLLEVISLARLGKRFGDGEAIGSQMVVATAAGLFGTLALIVGEILIVH